MTTLRDVCKWYKGLPHQDAALDYLQGELPQGLMHCFLMKWRDAPEEQVKEERPISTINQAGVDLIKQWEGLRLEAYLCPAGVWTIGYGHTGDVDPLDVITEEEAEDLLRKDLWRFEDAVSNLVRVSLSDNEYAALVSFTYNLGVGAFSQSTLLRRLNLGEQPGIVIQQEFPRWVNANGEKLQGLVNRRNDEIRLALS
jgi:lysozyme